MTQEQKLDKLIVIPKIPSRFPGVPGNLHGMETKDFTSVEFKINELIDWATAIDELLQSKELKTEEIKPDVTTSEEVAEQSYETASNLKKECTVAWKPQPGQCIWTIYPTYNAPQRDYWGSPKPTKGQLALWKLGVVFETEQEAVDYLEKV